MGVRNNILKVKNCFEKHAFFKVGSVAGFLFGMIYGVANW